MRITVTQLRMLVLVVNLVLAGSLVYKALDAYDVIDIVFGEGVNVESHPARVELRNFVYVPEKFPEQDPALLVTRVSTDLQPTKPELPVLKKPDPIETKPDDEVAGGPEELPEGPLAKEWEYVYYIAWHGDSGLRNFAQLRKKKDEPAKSGISRAARRSTISSRARNTRNTRVTRGASRYRTTKSDSVSFLVSDRRIKNEEFELDFWVHSADKEKLEYWMPGRPEKHYALPYKHEGSYLGQGSRRRELRPADDEEDDEDEDEEKKKFYLVHEDANPEEAREKRYEDIAAGRTSESKFTPSSGKRPRKDAEAADPDAGGRGANRSRSIRSSQGGPTQPTKEDIEELKSAIDKIPEEKQELLKKELNGMIQGEQK